MEITKDTQLKDLVDLACANAKLLFIDEEFMVRDLFRGYEWKRIMKITRRLGRDFYEFVKEHPSEFAVLNKTSQNQQRYKKIES